MTVEVLDRTKGLLGNISPTGTKYSVVLIKGGNMLYQIKMSSGSLPVNLSGWYTSEARAQTDLTKFLTDRWNESDEASDKAAARKRA